MKLKLLSVLLISVFSATAIYADDAANNAMPANGANAASSTAPVNKKTDEEILGTLVVINKNEIAAANEIENKKVSPEVEKFAQMMTKEHGANLQETLKLASKIGKPIENADAKNMAQDGKTELATMKNLKGQQLEMTYINNMVTGHENALKTIDDNLLKNVSNPELKKMLEATREHVAHHLDVAKQIQGQLKTNS